MKKVQETLASIKQASAKTQWVCLDGVEEDKKRLRRQITELEASVAKFKSDRKNIKTRERKKVTEFYQAQFQSQLAADRARTNKGSIWRATNAVFTAYPDLEWSNIEPFFDPQTPIATCIATLRAQHLAQSNQETSSSALSGSKTPPASK